MKDCLEQHRQDDGFSSECREEIETMMQERATDFRLDSSLRDACEEDIMYTCGWDDVSPFTSVFAFLLLLHTQRQASYSSRVWCRLEPVQVARAHLA